MNANTIRNVMGEIADINGSTPSPPILAEVGRRNSIAYTNTTLPLLVTNAPWFVTAEGVTDGDAQSLANAVALWLTTSIIPKVREEVLKESEKEAQDVVREVREEMESVKEVNREMLGHGSPEDCHYLFEKQMEKLETEVKDKRETKLMVDAIEVAILAKKGHSFVSKEGGGYEYVADEGQRKEAHAMRQEIVTLNKSRAERHHAYLHAATGSKLEEKGFSSDKSEFPQGVLKMSTELFFASFSRWLLQHSHDYWVLHPFLMRIMTSYDSGEGIFWMPPHPKDIQTDLPWMVNEYIEQGERMGALMKEKWEKDWNVITDTYTYGIDGQFSVSEVFLMGDALRIVHCLMSRISDVEGNARDQIEMELLAIPIKFKTLHPKTASDDLSALLLKASNVQATIPFRLAVQICEPLVQRNVTFFPLVERYSSLPANTKRDKCGGLLLKLLTEIKERAEKIDRAEGKASFTRFIGESDREDLRAVNSSDYTSGKNDGGGRKNFPSCRADSCSTKVCEARASKLRPYPPHPAGLCLEHFFLMIRNKAVKLRDGKYMCSEKQADGTWRYSTSNTHEIKSRPKKAFFITKSEELVNQMIDMTSDPSEEGVVCEGMLEYMFDQVRAISNNMPSQNKRKREGENTVVERDSSEMASLFANNVGE